MSKPWALVTPASRGIGLQLARHLLENTDVPVVATARKALDTTRSHILDGLDVDEERLQVLQLDVTGTVHPAHVSLHPSLDENIYSLLHSRRIHYCCYRRQNYFPLPLQLPPPPPRLLHTRYPLPREKSSANRP